MTINKKGHELTINQLSNGERCLLAMVGDLAQRLAIANPRLKNPLEGSGIVLIDEIELHLHPQMQQEIIPRLSQTFPNCQFMMTTHSPLVVSHIPSQGVYCLKETPNGIIVLNTESSMGKSREEILQELMEVSPTAQKTKK
jgi:predicted ATP-binding protein involved in virulence